MNQIFALPAPDRYTIKALKNVKNNEIRISHTRHSPINKHMFKNDTTWFTTEFLLGKLNLLYGLKQSNVFHFSTNHIHGMQKI